MTLDTTPAAAPAAVDVNPYAQLLWPNLASAPESVLGDLCASIGKRREQINVAYAGLVFERFRRRAVELLPIDAEWVRLSVDTSGDEATFVFDSAWGDDLEPFDDDLLDEVRNNAEVQALAGELEGVVADDYLVFNPTSGACFEGRDGAPAPWCATDISMTREMADAIGMPAWVRQAEQIFGDGQAGEPVDEPEPVAGW